MTMHPSDERLHDFVDGKLRGADRDAVATHLMDCERCQTIVSATEDLIADGRAVREDGTAPADLWPLVAATTIHDRIVRRHVLRSIKREIGIAAAVLMLLSGTAGAFGMRIAMRAAGEDHDRTVRREQVRVAPQVVVRSEVSGGSGSGGGSGFSVMVPEAPMAPVGPGTHASHPKLAENPNLVGRALANALEAREKAAIARLQTDAHRESARELLEPSDALLRRTRSDVLNEQGEPLHAAALRSLYDYRFTLIESRLGGRAEQPEPR